MAEKTIDFAELVRHIKDLEKLINILDETETRIANMKEEVMDFITNNIATIEKHKLERLLKDFNTPDYDFFRNCIATALAAGNIENAKFMSEACDRVYSGPVYIAAKAAIDTGSLADLTKIDAKSIDWICGNAYEFDDELSLLHLACQQNDIDITRYIFKHACAKNQVAAIGILFADFDAEKTSSVIFGNGNKFKRLSADDIKTLMIGDVEFMEIVININKLADQQTL